MNYYCFVAGSKDLTLDTAKGVPSVHELLEEYQNILSKKDARLLRLLRLSYDNANIISLINNKDTDISPIGNISKETWLDALPNLNDTVSASIYKEYNIEPYLTEFYQTITNETLASKIDFPELYISSLYYKHALKSTNKFIAQWFGYNLNLNNVYSAIICKKHGWDVTKNIVEGNEIADTILNNYTTKDLGLNGTYDELDTINTIADLPRLIEREKRIDALRWNWLEENTFFHDFSIERLLSYWLKCELLHRWDYLTVEKGTEVFRTILSDLKKDIKI